MNYSESCIIQVGIFKDGTYDASEDDLREIAIRLSRTQEARVEELPTGKDIVSARLSGDRYISSVAVLASIGHYAAGLVAGTYLTGNSIYGKQGGKVLYDSPNDVILSFRETDARWELRGDGSTIAVFKLITGDE